MIKVKIENKVQTKIVTLSKKKVETYLDNLSEMSHMDLDTVISQCSTEVGLRFMAKHLLQSSSCYRVRMIEEGVLETEEFDDRAEALELVSSKTKEEGYEMFVEYNDDDTEFVLTKYLYHNTKDIETSIEVLDSALMGKLEGEKTENELNNQNLIKTAM